MFNFHLWVDSYMDHSANYPKTSNPWIELGNYLIEISPTWGTGLRESLFGK